MRSSQPDDSSSHIHHLLNDPLVQKVMHSDKVDMSALLASFLFARPVNCESNIPNSAAGSSVVPERVPPRAALGTVAGAANVKNGF